jgi:hypothetical protein
VLSRRVERHQEVSSDLERKNSRENEWLDENSRLVFNTGAIVGRPYPPALRYANKAQPYLDGWQDCRDGWERPGRNLLISGEGLLSGM